MYSYQKDFAEFDGEIWLNAASEGPLPLAAAQSLSEAVEWKSKPYLLTIPRFIATQNGLKESIGRLVHVASKDVILANSASYGLHLLANGIPWQKGDEIILMQNDFPADILPWLALQTNGVQVRQIKPRDRVLQAEELLEHVTPKTKLVCLPHVHTFTGMTLDVPRLSDICRKQGLWFVLNISQSVGTMEVDVAKFNVDAVVAAGYKWLCGPYGTGFCWIKPELREQLIYNQAYWPAVLSEAELHTEGVLELKDTRTARKFDVLGTANFFNFVPFKTAIDYWLDRGVSHVRAYHDRLIEHFLTSLKRDAFELTSPRDGEQRSSLIVFSHKHSKLNKQIFEELKRNKIYVALWRGKLRVAPHVYNTSDEIDKITGLLNTFR